MTVPAAPARKRVQLRVCSAFVLGLLALADLHAQLTVTLTATDHHGFEVSCFGSKDGAIHAQASGGVPPYTYSWSTGEVTQDISGLAAGYYGVTVKDHVGTGTRGEITLSEPDPLKYEAQVQEYPNGFNISCYQCFNGNIQVAPVGGVAPFTYQWKDGPTTQNRSGLGEDALSVIITDVNGCSLQSETFQIRSPERTDWTMGGNANTNPATQYLGTSDNKDVVFKSNGQEGLRLKSNGDIKISGSLTGFGLLYRDPDGILRSGGLPLFPLLPGHPCRLLDYFPYWQTTGNSFPLLCPDEIPKLGTMDNNPLNVYTNGQQRMVITTTGKVGIGTEPPDGNIDQYRLYVEDGIVTRDVLAKTGPWPDYVFKSDYHLMPLENWRNFIRDHGHLPGMLSAAEVEKKGGIELADSHTRLVKVVEEQALYILQLEERITKLEEIHH